MATLIWVRDNFDANKNRYIDADELEAARTAWNKDHINLDQFSEVINAHNNHVQLPAYTDTSTTTSHMVTFVVPNGAALKVGSIIVV